MATSYEIRTSPDLTALQNDFSSATLIEATVVTEGSLIPQMAGQKVTFTFDSTDVMDAAVDNYFAMKAADNVGGVSSMSNIAVVYTSVDGNGNGGDGSGSTDEGMNAGTIAAIVIGSVFGIFLIVLAVFYVVVKKEVKLTPTKREHIISYN